MRERALNEVTAIVLAGGRSTRMGRDKASLVLGGRALLQRAVDACGEAASAVVVVTAPGRELSGVTSALPLTFVTDAEEGAGPLAGIVAGLSAIQTPVALVVACDMPFIAPELLRFLASSIGDGVSAAVPVLDGQAQPLCSAVRADALEALQAAFAGGTRAASAVGDLPGARLIQAAEWRVVDPTGTSFVGVNTPEEWARAEALEAALQQRT